MKRFPQVVALSVLSIGLTAGLASAQDRHDDPRNGHDNHAQDNRPPNGNDNRPQPGHDNQRYVRHSDWRKGRRMNSNDWNRGQRINYRTYRLNAPPRGYEWRQVDGNYVLAAAATGLIASVIAASANR